MIQQDSILLLDTLRDDAEVVIPQYYREGYFSKDSLLHPELEGGHAGVMGDPIPYSVRTDDVLTMIMLFLFVMAVIAFSNVRGFFSRQAKNFFYVPREGTTEVTETASEVRFQVFTLFLTALLFALLYYFYALRSIGTTFMLSSQYYLILIYLGIFIAYFLLKIGSYSVVNKVFFGGKKNRQWVKSLLFIGALEGLMMIPAIVMGPYFDLPVKTIALYVAFVLIFVKLLTFYKCFIIFFRQNVVSLQIILYLCALEIVPLFALWGLLGMTTNSLKINF